MGTRAVAVGLALLAAGCGTGSEVAVETGADPMRDPPRRQVYFGDLHAHTWYSFDAFIFGSRTTPDDAYRYARGEPLRHPSGAELHLDRPLDFFAVTDRAMFLGNPLGWSEGRGRTADHPVARAVAAAAEAPAVAKTAGEDRAAALREMAPYLLPGEHAALLDRGLVHSAWQEIQQAAERHDDPGRFTTFIAYEYTSGPDLGAPHRTVIFRGAEVPDQPFGRLDSADTERLWAWMDALRDRGIDSVAIPHAVHGSDGPTLALADPAAALNDGRADRRRRNEPLVAMTGAGLTGVWADGNGRAAIFDALRRRETFATSGPRMVVRLFAGFDLPEDLHLAADPAEIGYVQGIPMGGDLAPAAGTLRFVATALMDPLGAPLQRLQMVKGWVEDGEPRERIYDVACPDGQAVDADSHRCADAALHIDPSNCGASAESGARQLAATWQDPDFDPHQEAFYYLRVLEYPTCRRSTPDPLEAAPRDPLPEPVQERAWTSPIWYHGQAG